ncbi:MAG: hypothetical protein WCK67_07940 [bacterium]
MSIDKELILKKRNLLISKEYQEIRTYQLNHIVNQANSTIDPLIIKGMLKLIADTDKWEDDFMRAKKESNK